MKLPFLPFDQWTDTRITLHLILQIMGKIRLASTPRKNHWWYITLYVSTRGFSTQAIPMSDGINSFEMVLDVYDQAFRILNSRGEQEIIQLKQGYTVGEFYKKVLDILKRWGEQPEFVGKPFDMQVDTPFAEITAYHHYDWEAIYQFWQMMLWCDGVFKEFSGHFYGKTCPVHLYWHHMDLAVTRFSGNSAPPMDPKARISDKDAYSHEVISFGFWAGDDNMPEPAFYAYTAPAPAALGKEPLKPAAAFWQNPDDNPMAILKYKDLLSKENPRQDLLDFLESAYQAGAKLANWDIEAFKVKPLKNL